MIKRGGFLSLLFFYGLLCTAQNKQLLYNVESLPQSLMSNPGTSIHFDRHIGIPALSGLSFEAGSSGVSAYDIFREGGDINHAIDLAITNLDEKDFFTVNQQFELLSFGWRNREGDTYYSGGLYQETDVLLYFPSDLATLAYRGNAGFIDTAFEFSDLNATAQLLTAYHFGINKELSEKWQVGARAKVYMSIANVHSTKNEGNFITRTTIDGPNFYEHQVRSGVVQAATSGLEFLYDDKGYDAGQTIKSAIWSGNKGLGVDLGFTHFIDEHWRITGSAIDLGFIRHSKDTRSYRVAGSYATSGIALEFPAIINGTTPSEYWDEFQDEFEDSFTVTDSIRDGYTTWRPLKLNFSAQYGFGDAYSEGCDCTNNSRTNDPNKVGLHLYSIKRPQGFQAAATAYFDRRWGEWLRTRFTYTVDPRSANNIGLLVSTDFKHFNLYLAADNLLSYPNLAKAQGASVQLGMQLIFDSKNK